MLEQLAGMLGQKPKASLTAANIIPSLKMDPEKCLLLTMP